MSWSPPAAPLPAKAAQKATLRNKIPVVFTSVTDPVDLELVTTLDNPGGNLTGIAGMTSELDVPRLEILCELLVGLKKTENWSAQQYEASRPL